MGRAVLVLVCLAACTPREPTPLPPDDGGKIRSGSPSLVVGRGDPFRALEDNAPVGLPLVVTLQVRNLAPEGAVLEYRILEADSLAPLFDGGAFPVTLVPIDRLTCEARDVTIPVDAPERVQGRSTWLDVRVRDGEGREAAVRQRIHVTAPSDGGALDGGHAGASDGGG